MRYITKINIVLTAFIVGVPVLLFFQNCGQPGSVAVSDGIDLSSAKTTSDTLIVAPPSDSYDVHLDDPNTEDTEDNDSVSSAKGSIGQCDQLIVSDILLKIDSISSNSAGPNELSFEIVDSDKFISLEKLTLKIKALKSENVHQLMLILSSSGNKVLSSDSVAMELKTPSAQQSGIKIHLEQEQSVIEGQTYSLALVINPNNQIVTNKNKCLFKPVIQSATLSAL